MAWIVPAVVDAFGDGATEQAEAARDAQVGSAQAAANARTAEAQAMAEARRYEADQMLEARRIESEDRAETRQMEAQLRYDGMVVDSNNRLRETSMQNQTMRFGIMKNSQDFQFQILSWLTVQLEGLDTKTQIAFKDAEVRLAQISSDTRIQEKELELDGRELDLREAEMRRPQEVSAASFRV